MSTIRPIHPETFAMEAAHARANALAAGYDAQRGETWAAYVRRTVGNAGRLAESFGPTLLRDAPETALRDARALFELADDGEAYFLRPRGSQGWKPLKTAPSRAAGIEVGDLVWRWENNGDDTLLVCDGNDLRPARTRNTAVVMHGLVDGWEGGALSPATMIDVAPIGARRSRALVGIGRELLPLVDASHVDDVRALLDLVERFTRGEVDAPAVVAAAEAADASVEFEGQQAAYAARYTVVGLAFAVTEGGDVPSLLGSTGVPAERLAAIVRHHLPLASVAYGLAGLPDPLL